MKKQLAAVTVALACAGMAWAAGVVTPDQLASEQARKLVQGREAGPPEECMRVTPRTKLRIVDPSVVVAYDSVSRFNVNLVAPGCTALQEDRIIMIDMDRRRICAGDVFGVADLRTGIQYGSCRWGQFIPFTRVKTD
jgi:hypothetical protein